MKTKLLKGFAKVVCILFVVAFVFGMIYTVGQVVPSTRGVIHKVARLVFLESFAQRYLPIESAKAHQTEPSQEHAESAPAMEPVRDIMLSPTAAGNLGLNDSTLAQVEVIDYYKSLILPAVITERPGLSTINVPAPLSGVITKIYHETGVAVTTGTALFDILLNQQDMIQTQSDYIAALKAQEINESEIARLSVLDTGIAPQKRRELTFEKERLSVDIANKKRTLELLGLPPERIGEQLEKKRELIKSITIYVPNISEEGSLAPDKTVTKRILTLDRLDVTMGQNIVLGESLCQLSDLNQLVIQGKVFASDETKISTARLEKRRVSAVFGGNGNRETVEKLHIRSIDNRVDVKNGIIY
ncbi:MAG: efflux RND transporter periplasmic adaptor subunit, partial [Thermoguttaceae bacterium]|nr:efflux RND transporter periplasmic adaptor subunit [Thermoguttaceae bacterium]